MKAAVDRKARLLLLLFTVLVGASAGMLAPNTVNAGAFCGGSTSNGCACGKVNIYPCCDNNANCTWYAWRSMCCHWAFGPGNWGNANTWAGNGKKHPDVEWLASPVVGAVATRDIGKFGHVAYVVEVSGGKVRVEEQNCDYGKGGVLSTWYNASYFNSGYLVKKGSQNQGPSCGNGKCESGENCSNCGKDCGGCCGNGACDYGENCASCGKDCGACCGNGACDHGETCGSCKKDCHCKPEGALGTATCGLVSGWAYDPNLPDQKLDIRIKADGKMQSQTTANGSFPGHDGRGFSWVPSPEFKQGQVCKVTAEAQDADEDAFSTLGPKSFLCDNATTHEGIWTTTRKDAAGIDVKLPAGPHQGLQHAHPAGYPYPLSGVVTSCTRPGLEPFDELKATLSWDLASHHHAVAMSVDGKGKGGWPCPTCTDKQAAGSTQDLAIETPGDLVCVATTALAQVDAPQPAVWTLADLRWRKGRWWNGYSANAAGLVVGHPQADGARMQLRPEAKAVQGSAQAWLDLPEAFDSVRYVLKTQLQSGLQASLVVGSTTVVALPGSQVARKLDGLVAGSKAWRLTLQAEVDAKIAPTAAVDWQQVRVLKSDTLADGPWTVQRHDAWGLDAGVPDDATPSAVGLAVTLGARPMGWWTTGVVSMTAEVRGVPFERVRARLQAQLPSLPSVRKAGPWQVASPEGPGPGLPNRLELRVDGSPVAMLPTAANGVHDLDVPATGNRLTLAFGLETEQPAAPPVAVRLDGIELLRRGWWTAPSPKCAGLRDDRVEGGGVLLETARPWGMAGHALQGFARVYRTFERPQTGVKFHYRQDLGGMAMRVLVLADGLPLAVFDDDGLLEKDIELASPGFKDLALVLAPKADGGVHPHHWWAEFTAVATRAEDGTWQRTVDVATAVKGGLVDGAALGDATAGKGPGGTSAGGSGPSGGCSTGRNGSDGAVLALLLLGMMAMVGRRRRRIA